MRFSLQEMARQTLAEADRREMEKRAMEESADDKKKKGKVPPTAAKSPPDNTSTAPERNEESYEEKTSSAFVEKLASAVEYLGENFLKVAVGEPEPPLSHGVEGTAPGIGPGEGAGTLELNRQPTPGMQSTNTGQARTQIPTNPGNDPKSPGQTNPDTAMETDINNPAGGNEDWTNQDKMKQASKAGLRQRVESFVRGRPSAYRDAREHLRGAVSKGNTLKERAAQVGRAAKNVAPEAGAAAGLGVTGYGIHRATRGNSKSKEASVARVQSIMDKMAADANNPASIGAKTTNPHQSSPEGVSASEQGPKPAQPGEVTRQSSMVGSNASAINYTKQQAKAVPKARMGEVLAEPAQKKSTDPVLHENLDATSGAGVKLSSVTKVAAARSLLEKIAQEGTAEGASPEQKEKAEKLQQLLQAKQQEKEKQSGLPIGGGY